MNVFQPWQLPLVSLAGWINRQQQDVIACIQEENRILKNKLKGKRIRFTDDERRRLAVKGRALGRVLRCRCRRHGGAASILMYTQKRFVLASGRETNPSLTQSRC